MLLPRNHHHLHLSTCLGGGSRAPAAYAFEVEMVKSSSPSPSSSSSSSSLSTSSSASVATRKARTPRKRPNQTYNEAAALLSASYPNLFDSPKKGTMSSMTIPFLFINNESDHNSLLFPPPQPPPFSPRLLLRSSSSSSSPATIPDYEHHCDEFDADSLLDHSAPGGIDTIMGDLSAAIVDLSATAAWLPSPRPPGLALRHRDTANWWCFPAVDMFDLNPITSSASAKQKKMKKANNNNNKFIKVVAESATPPEGGVLALNLNYDGVIRDWSGKGSPFSDQETLHCDHNVAARAAEIELFPEERGGVREASVLRYKEKRRTRLFSKKIIRYQVRKVNADRRPRMKGRFVRRPNSKHN